jgi:hypothetical protein
MAKKEERIDPVILTLEDVGEEYTLEFDRDSVRFAEARGFDPSDIGKYPMTKVYELFFYAFRMHHKGVARDKTDKIIDNYFGGVAGLPEGLLERLGELYAQPFTSLEDKEGKKGKATIRL